MSTMPTGPVKLSFEDDNNQLSEPLWNAIKTIINSKVDQVRTLLYKFNVPEDAISIFLCKF